MTCKLDHCLNNVDAVDKTLLNAINEDICELFKESASKCDMIQFCNNNGKGRNNENIVKNKWFNDDCKKLRKVYHRCKNKYRKVYLGQYKT